MPFFPGGFVEGKFRVVSADAVVNLPGDELRMIPQSLDHGLDDAPGIIPKSVAVQTDGPARAFVFDLAAFVERKNIRMFLGEPDGRGGGGRAEHHADAVTPHDVHDTAEPEEIVVAFFGFAQPPGEFPDADDVDAGLGH